MDHTGQGREPYEMRYQAWTSLHVLSIPDAIGWPPFRASCAREVRSRTVKMLWAVEDEDDRVDQVEPTPRSRVRGERHKVEESLLPCKGVVVTTKKKLPLQRKMK
jgi:hypothetical protein